MATLPSASLVIDDEAGGFAGGTGYIAVLGTAEQNADSTPRVFSSAKALLDQHGYAQGVDYAAQHIDETGLPVIYVAMPTATAGAITRANAAGVTGSSVVAATAGSHGVLEEVDASVTVTRGGTIGTDSIEFDLSLDGGRTTKRVRLGTANSYVIPYVGITLTFGAGTLAAGDVYTFESTAPMWDAAGLTAARQALAAQQKAVRSWLIAGDLPNSTFAGYVVTEANAYASSSDRYIVARASVVDRVPRASATGSFSYVAASHKITRSSGSWLADGFRVGDVPTVSGTTSNNGSHGAITALTATDITFASGLADEGPVSSTVTKGQTMAAYVSATETAFASVDGQRRVDLSLGRGKRLSPITGWSFRRPTAWSASIREYQHDVHIATYRKSDGPLSNFDLTDGQGQVVEYDERTVGGALAAKFTCARTWANGPNGAFIALSLTRADEASLLSRTHNMHVTNVACSVCHAETENAIGQSLVLNDDGTATPASLQKIEQRVNSSLQRALLQQGVEGQRASKAVWQADPTCILNVPGATLTGTLTLELNGTLEQIETSVRIVTG